ncbi:MAG: ABC transporter substrate-binding protein [Acidimicrobiia bacterium]|nr:ABC transporter substrate-binding protein [Acidimicrobiia bacterium]
MHTPSNALSSSRGRSGRFWLALLLAIGLFAAGCGSDDTSDSSTSDTTTAEEESAAEDEATDTTMAEETDTTEAADDSAAVCTEPGQGITDATIKIGSTQPLSGGAATAGEAFAAGLEAAAQERNDAGGINGRMIELTILDDGFEAARSVANVRRLGDEEEVFAVLSPAGSANLPGSYEYLSQKGLPMFAPVLPPDPDQQEVYLIGTGHSDQVRLIVDWLAEQGVTSIGLLRQDNDLGAAFKAGLEAQAPKHNIEIVAEEVVEPQSTDVSAQVLNIRDADPDAVISGADNTQTALLLDQAYDLGWEPIIIGNSSTAGPGAVGTVGAAAPEAAEGFYGSAILAFTTSDAPEVQAYRAAMDAAGHSDVADNAFGLQAYAHSIVFYSVLESLGDDLCWDALHASLESLDNFETGLVAPVTFGPVPGGHSGTTGARIAQYTGGDWVFITDFLQPQD